MNRRARSPLAVLVVAFVAGCNPSNGRGTAAAGGTAGGTSTGGTGGPGGTGGAAGAATGGSGGTAGTGGAGTGGGGAGTGGGEGRADGGGRGPSDARVAADAAVDRAAPAGDLPAGKLPRVDTFDVDACHDLDIAVGPSVVGVATNPGVANFYMKSGALAYKTTPFPGASVGDAHISYDASAKRFFFSTLQSRNGMDGAFISVSADDTGRTWSAPARVMGPTDLDNPQLVVTSDKVCLLVFECVYTMDKSAVLAGGASIPSVSSCGIRHTDQTYGVDYGPQVPSTCYFAVMSDDQHFNWISVDGTPAGGDVKLVQHPTALATRFTRVPAFPGVTAFGGLVTRNSGNLAEWFGGHLWWSQSGRCGADVCPRMFEVDTATGTLTDFDVGLPGFTLWSAAPGIDKDGNMYALMAQSNATTPLSLAVAGVTAGGAKIPPQTVFKGTGTFPAEQFGDFFDAAQDPVDGTVWGVGNYAKNGACGARVVHVTATPAP
jgi:hypothetical protein